MLFMTSPASAGKTHLGQNVSRLVLVTNDANNPCPCSGWPNMMGNQFNPDGTQGPLTIPVGQKFVVTDVAWDSLGPYPFDLILFIENNTTCAFTQVFRSTATDSSMQNVAMTTGFVVGPGTCLSTPPGLNTLHFLLRGYLVRD
jgi:hypothetical protein